MCLRLGRTSLACPQYLSHVDCQMACLLGCSLLGNGLMKRPSYPLLVPMNNLLAQVDTDSYGAVYFSDVPTTPLWLYGVYIGLAVVVVLLLGWGLVKLKKLLTRPEMHGLT